MAIVVARHPSYVTLNPLEFLLESDNSGYMLFDSKEDACDFLREHVFPDTTNEQLEEVFQFMTPEEAEAYEDATYGSAEGSEA